MRVRSVRWAVAAAVLALAAAVTAQQMGGRGRDPGHGSDAGEVYLSAIPAYAGNVILGRPTDRSAVASVMMNRAARVRVRYGLPDHLDRRTDPVDLAAGEPREILLDGLSADMDYAYRVEDAGTGKALLPESGSGSFRTQRKPGSAFTFTIQADSHLDSQCSTDVYRRTLTNVAAEHPDFHIDLGDTSMTGKIADHDRAANQYQAQRYWLGLVGGTAPLFLSIGNHDGEEAFRRGAADEDGLAVWACKQRKRFFPNPLPDAFYTGDSVPQPYAGPLQDYYAWEWGDALFVVLDPYWYSGPNRGGTEPWSSTLGEAQYRWLSRTLHASKARWKFVFIHQLVGGLDAGGRGGVEAVPLYEWGGHEKDGTDTFAANRPGWAEPIHSLFVKTGVTVLFHGHDHFFAHQQRDGIVYQLVPQPASLNNRRELASEYGYVAGDLLPSSGHLRVKVAPDRVDVDYIRTTDTGAQPPVAFHYTLPANIPSAH